MEAPTFDAARMELYTQLAPFVFVRLPRRAAVPAESRPGTTGYFHGVGQCVSEEGKGGRVWYQKTSMAQRPLSLGPLAIAPPPPEDTYVPQAGDIFIGKTVPPNAGSSSQGEKNDRLVNWYPFADPLFHLFHLVCNGTAKTEDALAHELRLRSKSGPDDVWALARLVLFGNVRVFAEEHIHASSAKMRLSTPPLHFVHAASTSLRDNSIWTEFVKLVPDAVPPRPPSPPPKAAPPPPRPIVRPLSKPMMTAEQAMARTRGDYGALYTPRDDTLKEYNPESPAYYPTAYTQQQPHSPRFAVNTPPDSPPFVLNTPPESPPYRPLSPKRQAREFSPPPICLGDVSRLLSHVDQIQQRAASHF